MKLLLHRSFVFALQVTISQAGIAAQMLPVTLSLMQRFEEKKKHSMIVLNHETSLARSAQMELER